ncbi:MAG TPA: hypothetical protein PKC86_01140 [Candidatus Saccharibacteria bacterium]|nr:hypothetical protein [Candidatus Saccharibacteria bacterium]
MKWAGLSVMGTRAYVILITGGLVCAFLAITLLPTSASAISNIGPDKNEFSNNARYALQHGSQLVIDKITVPVYYPTMPTQPVTVTASGFDFEGRTGTRRASVSFNGGPYVQSDTTFNLSASSFSKVPGTNYYASIVTSNINDSSVDRLVNYRLSVPSPGLIGYLATSGSSFGIANQSRCSSMSCGVYYDYSIPFAPPCTESPNKRVSAVIYDGDNGNPGVQPTDFNVQIYDVTSAQYISATRSGSEGDGGTAYYTFTVQPSHRYQFKVNNVFTNNVLQFSLPYDSINYTTDCGEYNLTPNVSVNRGSGEPGGVVSVTPSVLNEGFGPSVDTKWRISTMAFASDDSIPDAENSTSEPCTYFISKGSFDCRVESGNEGVGSFSSAVDARFTKKSGDDWGVKNLEIGDFSAGTRLCYVLSVQARSSKSVEWANSAPKCLIIGKTPKAQIWGGDLVVGRYFIGQTPSGVSSSVTTSVSMKTAGGEKHAFGSWIEYGIFSTGSITGTASESAFSGPSGMLISNPNSACPYSSLSFTNVDPNSANCNDIGNYSLSGSIPDVSSSFPINSSTSRLSVTPASNNITGLSGVYTADGDINITSGGDIPKGHWIVINAPGRTVTVNSNITYTSETLSKLSDIPQVLIIAKDISIAGNVTRVDAWLVASDKVNTCSSVSDTANLSIDICNNPLVVNGPVMADKLFLRRTAGSGIGASSGDPAEIFNLRADAYLWAAERSMSLGRAETVYYTELPPRF